MAEHLLDCQDELHGALRALEGLRDLFYEAQGPDKRQYNALGPDGCAELIDMVEKRFRRVDVLLDTVADEVFGRV